MQIDAAIAIAMHADGITEAATEEEIDETFGWIGKGGLDEILQGSTVCIHCGSTESF